jgi:rubrerythrin
MSEHQKISLSIAENAHAFLNESVEKAIQAGEDVRHWQFAILHLVQSLELSLKSLLREINEILVYENIENPKNTISITKAIQRLEQPMIKGLSFADGEKNKILEAIDLRNKITHADFEFTELYAEKKFFELFAFVTYFHARYLHTEIEDIIPVKNLSSLVSIEKSREELLKKALARISEENIDSELIWECPSCAEDTFIIQDNIDACYLCRHKEDVVECPQCKDFYFDWQIESFEESIDYHHEEGRTVIYNDYGYSKYYACPECLPEILEEIQQKRDAKYDVWRSMIEDQRR